MLGVAPISGRALTRDDMNPGAPLVALVGYGYWQSRYGGNADVIGQSIGLDDENATIVGVLPAWFDATTPLRHRCACSLPCSIAAAPACPSKRAFVPD